MIVAVMILMNMVMTMRVLVHVVVMGGGESGSDDESNVDTLHSGGDDISDDNDEGIGYNGEEEGGVTCAKVSKSWMNLASFIKKHNLTDCAGEELIYLLGEQKEKDVLPSSIYKLK